jgi:hypothetical protein
MGTRGGERDQHGQEMLVARMCPVRPRAALAPVRERLAVVVGKALYKQRAATIECTNAQVRRRGLYQFLVRGRLKARGVLLWHALAHNLMRMRSLNIALQL